MEHYSKWLSTFCIKQKYLHWSDCRCCKCTFCCCSFDTCCFVVGHGCFCVCSTCYFDLKEKWCSLFKRICFPHFSLWRHSLRIQALWALFSFEWKAQTQQNFAVFSHFIPVFTCPECCHTSRTPLSLHSCHLLMWGFWLQQRLDVSLEV